jgi:hypothetical protein
MAVGVFGMQWFLLMASCSGSFTTDLVTLLDAESYFKSRMIAATTASLVDVAGKEASDGKTQIAQLLAIRWLGEHPAETKKDAKALALLQAIAAATRAQDPQGFARDYASRALARIDGKPAPMAAIPANSVTLESLKWFPGNVTFFGGIDFRSPPDFKGVDMKSPASLLDAFIPPRAREEMYKAAEDLGNLHIDRASMAFSQDPNQRENSRIYVRMTGRGDRKRLVEFIKKNMPNHTIKEEKSATGELITLISSEKEAPAFAVIGDTEVLMAGYEGNQAKHLEVLQEMLEIRAGKKKGLVAGPLSDELTTIPGTTSGLIMGELPEDMRKDLARGSPFKVFPASGAMYVVKGKDLAFRFRGNLASPGDAKSFCASVAQLKQMGIDGLKNLPANFKIKPKTVETLTKTIEGIKAEPKEATVSGGLDVSTPALEALNELVEMSLKAFGPLP